MKGADNKMSRLNKRVNKGISSVFGSVLILLLILTLSSALFLSLYSYEEKAQESINVEEERVEEKIVLLALSTENVSGIEYLKAVFINNTGTITTRIRAVYIDNNFVCDPADPSLNPNDTYIEPKDSRWLQIPSNLMYNPLSKIEVATERGMKSVEYEWKLKSGSQAEPPSETERSNFGPLLLDFEKFYYTENYGSYDPNSWKPGWSVEKGSTLVWNVTVTNVDDRDLTINKYSGFTMVSNDGGVQLPWFIEPPNGIDTLFIPSNSSAHLIYIWDRPRMTQGVKNQSVYNQNDRSKVFLTFFGVFHEHDGSTKPYGQTIPFEAILVRDPQMLITAAPTVIAAASTMRSTITVTVRDVMGILAVNVPVTFTTTFGNLGASTVNTNSNGIATVTFSSSTTGTAIITASWGGISKSVSVTVSSGTLSVSANPTTIAAGSTMTSTITARVLLNGNPLTGETVTFSATPTLGTLSAPTATTNSQGYATITFTPGSTTGTTTVTATWGTSTQTVPVVVAAGTLSLSASPSTIAAESAMTTTITAVLLLGGEPVDNTEIAFATDRGTLSSPTATTNSAGEAIVILTPSLTSGVATVNVIWQGLSESTQVTIATGEVLMQVTPTTITANTPDTADITVTVFLDGNPVVNGVVTFTTNSTQVILSDSTVQTDDFGMATITLSPGTTAEYVEITADWENIIDQRIVTIVE
jgi:hypothetical protein